MTMGRRQRTSQPVTQHPGKERQQCLALKDVILKLQIHSFVRFKSHLQNLNIVNLRVSFSHCSYNLV